MIVIELYTDAPAAYRPYDTRAPIVARLLADAITRAEPALAVEHIGSTAVPGCAGKGVIDLMVLYAPGDLSRARQALDAMGFQRQTTRDPFPEERPMRVGMLTYDRERFRVHAHVIAANSPEASELRTFRDRLRAEPGFRAAYEECKRSILTLGITDPVDYAEAKGGFIKG